MSFISASSAYPQRRMRRNRREAWCRRLVREVRLSVDDLILPLFVGEDGPEATEITALPGVKRYNLNGLVAVATHAMALGIPAVAIFPVIGDGAKTADGREATRPDNLIHRAIAAVKASCAPLGVIADVALDPYTTHGHDGVLVGAEVANDPTLEVLCQQAVQQGLAGCDVVAPSDMMDGRVGAIRRALDDAGLQHVRILSYAAKYASAFYGPFRAAIGSKTALGAADKRGYQMDPANAAEALREVALDVAESADMLLIKPGMPYLDVLWRVKQQFDMPTFAYQVSGEYSMLKLASMHGHLDWRQAMLESLWCFKRAGADAIVSYAALEVAGWLAAGDV